MGWQEVADAVVNRRVELGMRTRKQLADASGLTVKTLGEIERADRTSYDPATLAVVEQALQWSAGTIAAIVNGARVEGATVIQQTHLGPERPSASAPNGPRPTFTVDPDEPVEFTDQARRLSWLTGPTSPFDEVTRNRLVAAVEAVMAMMLPPGLPPRQPQDTFPRMSAERLREPSGDGLAEQQQR